MMSPTLDGGFFVCGQGRSERGCNQEAEVAKFERLLRQTGSGNQKLISLQIFLRVCCMTPPPLAQGLLTYGTAISWAHHVYFQNNLLAPPLLCKFKTYISLVGSLDRLSLGFVLHVLVSATSGAQHLFAQIGLLLTDLRSCKGN